MEDTTTPQGNDGGDGGASENAADPTQQAPEARRSIRPIADKRTGPKTQPFFRANTAENVEDFHRVDIREGDQPRGEDGKFVKADGEPEPKGNLSKPRDPKPRLRPTNAPPPEGEEEGGEPQPEPFVPVRIGKQRFNTQKELDDHIGRLTVDQRTNARRVSELQSTLEALTSKLGLPQEQPQQQQPREGQPSEPEKKVPTNPFLTSLLDENEENGKWWEEVGQYLGQGKQVMALAKMAESFEKRIQGLLEYIEHNQGERTAPMQSFLGALNTINTTSATFQQLAQSTSEDGAPLYPEIKTRADVRGLTDLMNEYSLPLDAKGFALAYDVWMSKKPGAKLSPMPPPRYEEPELEDHSAAAAAASVRNSSGPAVDPRAPKREPTMREQIEEMNRLNKRGMFNRLE